MNLKQRLIDVKDHVRENKSTYMIITGVGMTCFVAGALVSRQPISVSPEVMNKFTTFFSWKSNNTVITQLARRGHPGNLIKCIETGEVFASQNRAAKALGINAGQLAQHLKGVHDHVKGLHFVKLGEAI